MNKPITLILLLLLGFIGISQNKSMILSEYFTNIEGNLPDGWEIMNACTGTPRWMIQQTNHAGGEPWELYVTYNPRFVGKACMVTPAIDLTGLTEVAFSFKQYLTVYENSIKIGIATTSDNGATWNTGWTHDYTQDIRETVTQIISTPDIGKPSVRFGIYIEGDSYNFTDWFFDNIEIFSVDQYDVAMEQLFGENIVVSGYLPVSFSLYNFGSETVTSINATYEIGDLVIEETIPTNIPMFQKATVSFENMTKLMPGDYLLNVTVTKVNGNDDVNPSNNSLSKSINVALGSAHRTPCIEQNTSSTSIPCTYVNPDMLVFEQNNAGRYTYIKYHQWYPTPGDPYFTEEVHTRFSFYNSDGAPQFYMDGIDRRYNGITQAMFEEACNVPAFADIKGSFNVVDKTINVKVDVTTYIELPKKTVLQIVVNEKVTHNNTGTNGETSFPHVMMKFLDDVQGTLLGIGVGESATFEFSYDMSSTFVEEFDDLEVVAFVQNNYSQSIYNSCYLYEYTNDFPYSVENLNVEYYNNENQLVATWNAPSAGNPSGYNVYLDDVLVEENTTNLTFAFQSVEDYYVVGVEAVYPNGMVSIRKNIGTYGDGPTLTNETGFDENIYPNPANEILNINIKNLETVSIYNTNGGLVEMTNASNDSIIINTNNYKSGLYIILAKTRDNKLISRKIIVKH